MCRLVAVIVSAIVGNSPELFDPIVTSDCLCSINQ